LIPLTWFQTKYGMLSGPGDELAEHLERAADISSVVRAGADLKGLSLSGGEHWSLAGKKSSNRILFIC